MTEALSAAPRFPREEWRPGTHLGTGPPAHGEVQLYLENHAMCFGI